MARTVELTYTRLPTSVYDVMELRLRVPSHCFPFSPYYRPHYLGVCGTPLVETTDLADHFTSTCRLPDLLEKGSLV